MGAYDRQVATAERLIREKGKPVQVVRQSTTLPDPNRPWEPGEPVETLTDAHGVFLNFNAQDMETMSKMAGASEIQSSDRKVLLAAAAAGKPVRAEQQGYCTEHPETSGKRRTRMRHRKICEPVAGTRQG